MTRLMKDSGIEWIGEIPSHWQRVKTLYALEMPITDGPHETPELFDEGIPFVSAEAVSCGRGSIDFDHIRGYISEEYYIECCKKYVPALNDVLMIKSGATTGKVAVVNTDRIFTIWSPLAVFRFNSNVSDYQDMFYYLQSDAYQKQIENKWTFGTQQNIGMRTLEQLALCMPPLSEQHRIADFLDRRCAEIDAVIERTKATIEEYKKLKQAVITEAVTKGVRGARKMKDSGIEWIGEIPEGWTTVQLKRLARIATGSTPPKNVENTFYSCDSGCLWIKAEDLGTSNNIETTTEYLTEAGKHEGRIFPPCTVYVCCIASVGKVGFCLTEASCNQQINGLIFENAHWKYGFYMSLAQEEEYLLNASGNVMKILNTEKQSRLMCPCPPIDEQKEIATYLDEKCAALDTLIAKKTALLTELETYKKSLIYEYVTGKKEVP